MKNPTTILFQTVRHLLRLISVIWSSWEQPLQSEELSRACFHYLWGRQDASLVSVLIFRPCLCIRCKILAGLPHAHQPLLIVVMPFNSSFVSYHLHTLKLLPIDCGWQGCVRSFVDLHDVTEIPFTSRAMSACMAYTPPPESAEMLGSARRNITHKQQGREGVLKSGSLVTMKQNAKNSSPHINRWVIPLLLVTILVKYCTAWLLSQAPDQTD